MDHMWVVALPYLQPLADKCGFGEERRQMCESRTVKAAKAAAGVAAVADADAATWEHLNPWGLLERLINLDGEKK